jgi:hypothetical protein
MTELLHLPPPPALRRIDFELDGPIPGPWESPATALPTEKPRLQIPGDDRLTSWFATDLAKQLRTAGIFQRDGVAVIQTIDRTGLERISPIRFVTWIEDWVNCYRVKGGEEIDRSLSVSDAAKVLNAHQFLDELPIVERYNLIRLPSFDSDGNLNLLPTGFHKPTGTLTVRGSVRYALDWSVEQARKYLNNLLAEFPFANLEQSKATVIAAMLTVYGLHLLSPTCLIPAFIYTANDAGGGKGLCSMLATIPVFGSHPTGVQPSSEPDMEKLLFSAARAGQQLLVMDNVDRHLASASLESYLTTAHISGRIMGESTFVTYPKKAVVLISGNNCTVRADMRRRSLFVEFFLEDLQPEHRKIMNPLDEATILNKRESILAALYAMIRAWVTDGKPAPKRVLQGFTEWSQLVPAVLEHTGFGSPIPLPDTNVADQGMREAIQLVQALHNYNMVTGLPFREIVEICQSSQLFSDKIRSHGELTRQERTSFSRFLKRYENRIFPGGLRFVVTGESHGRRYSVAAITSEAPPVPAVTLEAS